MNLSRSFFLRSLAAAVAAASATLPAASADATNLTQLDASKWVGKSTDVGSFGAGYGASFTVDLVDGALTGEASGDASIQLFGSTMSIVALSATASINDDSADAASLDVEIAGVPVYEKSFSDGFEFDASEDVDEYEDTFCTEFFDVSNTFTVVVVPVTMTVGAEGCANLTFSAVPQYLTSTAQGKLNMDVEPGLDVDLTASVGAGTSAFSAGVEAEVTLLDFTLPITLDPAYSFTSSAFTCDTTGAIDLTMLEGSVSVYAEADAGFWDIKYSYELFDWDGISKTWYLWSSGKPTASSPVATVEGGKATGAYEYADTAGTPEGSSTYQWWRTSDPDLGTRSEITGATSKTRTLEDDDSGKYLQFCVKPKNDAGTPGEEQCSDWESVGKVASFYQHSTYGGTNLSIAYQKSTSGTCFNLDDYLGSFDNATSSYQLVAPTDSSAVFHFYKGYDCADTSSTEHMTVSASAGATQSSTYIGSSWNDKLTSVKVVFKESVTAEDVSVSISGNKASSSYTFTVGDSTSTTESGSTYVWKRASSSSGSGATVISSSTGSTRTLTADDDEKYLQVCVTPSNGNTTGSQACSGFTAVGHLLKLYEDAGYDGDSAMVAWEKSPRETCFNMSDLSLDNALSSYAFSNNSVAGSTLWLYQSANCAGTTATKSVSASGSVAVSSVGTTHGGAWQDSVSSFKISWNSSVNITTPTISISGDTATESHTYSGGQGLSEQATYTWYRAYSSGGSLAEVIENANDSTYTLTEDDNAMYLRVCVLSGNGVHVDESEVCSDWTKVGHVMSLYRGDLNDYFTGTSVTLAYEVTPEDANTMVSGYHPKCFNLADYDIDNALSSFYVMGLSSSSYVMVSLYDDADCSGTAAESASVAPNDFHIGWDLGTHDNTISSIKVLFFED